jgi:hypothetical protein
VLEMNMCLVALVTPGNADTSCCNAMYTYICVYIYIYIHIYIYI